MKDPLRGFEVLIAIWEENEDDKDGADRYSLACANHAKQLRVVLTSARTEIRQGMRDEFVAGVDFEIAKQTGEMRFAKADKVIAVEAIRRNP
jgi:hypothetical protein